MAYIDNSQNYISCPQLRSKLYIQLRAESVFTWIIHKDIPLNYLLCVKYTMLGSGSSEWRKQDSPVLVRLLTVKKAKPVK